MCKKGVMVVDWYAVPLRCIVYRDGGRTGRWRKDGGWTEGDLEGKKERPSKVRGRGEDMDGTRRRDRVTEVGTGRESATGGIR